MERLWTPWRMQYVSATGNDDEGCIFCAAQERPDEEAHVVFRGSRVFVLLNAFPYNTGHVMVAPTRHCANLPDLAPDEQAELMEVVSSCVEVIGSVMSAHGFNVGMNLGSAAGAGIPGHLHVHVVPRWGGDTNFMPVVGATKVLPEMLAESYAKLRPAFDAPRSV